MLISLHVHPRLSILILISAGIINTRSHANFNSTEVGEKLASEMLSKLDPTSISVPVADKDGLLIPVYTKPKALAATLPGMHTSCYITVHVYEYICTTTA